MRTQVLKNVSLSESTSNLYMIKYVYKLKSDNIKDHLTNFSMCGGGVMPDSIIVSQNGISNNISPILMNTSESRTGTRRTLVARAPTLRVMAGFQRFTL